MPMEADGCHLRRRWRLVWAFVFGDLCCGQVERGSWSASMSLLAGVLELFVGSMGHSVGPAMLVAGVTVPAS